MLSGINGFRCISGVDAFSDKVLADRLFVGVRSEIFNARQTSKICLIDIKKKLISVGTSNTIDFNIHFKG